MSSFEDLKESDALRRIAHHCVEAQKIAWAWGEEPIQALLIEALIAVSERLGELTPLQERTAPPRAGMGPDLALPSGLEPLVCAEGGDGGPV
ncbi:hypothetical protein SLNSH_13990 [Alsobacter soli]|uniref:Uncharacterized protein n=1 Tax=Alsobacter soli TaxID=2109933 RepID=A0A2T1HRR5_9HYPH|nr:hypothetical protein [Alsobacter soli]PSC04338.1 hypothetical protein SLNSH_13990 [Alsobacter soli]